MMSKTKKTFRIRFLIAILTLFGAIFSCLIPSTTTYAIDDDADYTPGGVVIPSNPNPDNSETPLEPIENTPERPTTPSDSTNTDPEETHDEDSDYLEGITNEEDNPENDSTSTVCEGQVGSMSWYLCPALNTIGDAIDNIYSFITDLLVVKPLTTDTDSTFYQIWKYIRDIANITFVIVMLIVIYSQVTGIGLNNYGIKNVLPRIIVGAILVNLSFIISAIAVDLSNIVGGSLIDFFNELQSSVVVPTDVLADISWGGVMKALAGGGTAAWVAVLAAGGIERIFWIVVIALLGAFISIVIGLITISLRQGVVLLLIMVSPLAFVAYLFPNTEKWYTKWKNLLCQMLFFFPMFSFLFGASKLAGWAIMTTPNNSPFRILLGLAVQVMPLFLTVSLLKMSGTILGQISAGLDRLSNPIRTTATAWGTSHALQAEKRFLKRNSFIGGARLRNYLLARQKRRELDIANNQNTIEGRATERALRSATSFKGYDKNGNAVWRSRPNSYTRNAKASALQTTRVEVAKRNLDNTLSEYGDIFTGQAAHRLSNAHAESYLAVMAQQFRAENIAQGDQSFLLNRYLAAAKNQFRNPYEFNRLIGGATGKMGHFGETTIMGQVVVRSAEIERRRKAEADIVDNKFGHVKGEFRGMLLNKKNVDDNGIEHDEDGNKLEDNQYRYLSADHARRHRDWDKYIGVHKDTGREISKEEYDSLSTKELQNYKKIRYMEIRDDDNDVVNRVYEDDAGYMKTLIDKDIAIGDPINVRYATEIGLTRRDSERTQITEGIDEKTGMLRRYHSTISASLLGQKYSEHAAAFTAMLVAQLNSGHITSMGQLNIASLDSLWKAAKAGKILQNDAIIINQYRDLLTCVDDPEKFAKLFPDEDIALYRNVNGERLKGAERVEYVDKNGNTRYKWEEIPRNEVATIEQQRNYLAHILIPETAAKIFGSANRRLSPEILNAQKPDGTEAFLNLVDSLLKQGEKNIMPDESIPFEERLNPDKNILGAQDPEVIRTKIREGRNAIYERVNAVLGPDEEKYPVDTGKKSKGHPKTAKQASSTTNLPKGNTLQKFNKTAERARESIEDEETYENPSDIVADFKDGLRYIEGFSELQDFVGTFFAEHDSLDDYLNEAYEIADNMWVNDDSTIDEAKAELETLIENAVYGYI